MIRIVEEDRKHPVHSVSKQDKHSLQVYKARYEICKNPLCTCCRLDMVFDTRNDQPLSPDLAVSFDLIERTVDGSTKGHESQQFANQLEGDLDDHDWGVLKKLFHIQKTLHTENADLMSLDVPFPIEEIESSSKLISYNEVIPFARYVRFEVEDTPIIVEDFYCVQPHCNCHDVYLSFTPYYKERILLPFMFESSEEAYFVYHIQKDKWKLEERTGLSIEPKRLMSALRDTHDIQKLYGTRYETIRRLYRNYRRRHAELRPLAAVSQGARVGRNDPCPCGSGKKYKKCCMLKDN